MALTTEEVLAAAREFSPGIAEWIDGQLKRGVSPIAIVEVLAATTALVKAERALQDTGTFGRDA